MAFDDLDIISNKISNRFERINVYYIRKIAEQIAQIGTMSPVSLNRLKVMAETNGNIAQINAMLADELGATLAELVDIYDKVASDYYADTIQFYKYNGMTQPPFKSNEPVQRMLEAMNRATLGTMSNFAHTTAINKNYTEIIDTAVQSVVSGGMTTEQIVRGNIKKLATQGIRVQYMGYDNNGNPRERRLDSAMRMNIRDGVRRVQEETRRIVGEQFKADGVELSAHALCAADHLPYQGLIFTNEQFAYIQSTLRREITTCNCKHITYPVITAIAKPTYSDAELNKFKQNSNTPITLANGKQVTKYEASQLMRQVETKIRYAKEQVIYAESLGNAPGAQDLVIEARTKVNNHMQAYADLARRSGLRGDANRIYVPGYRTKAIPQNRISTKPIGIDKK